MLEMLGSRRLQGKYVFRQKVKVTSPPIVCAIDEGYVVPYLVSVFSGVRSAELPGSTLEFSLAYYSSSLGQESIAFIGNVATALGIKIRMICLDDFEKIENVAHYPGLVFAKFIIAEIFTDDFVWIDADTLLLTGWDKVLSPGSREAHFTAASGAEDSWVKSNSKKLTHNPVVQSSLLAGRPYINAGVLQVRSLIWKQVFGNKWRQLASLANESSFTMADQDVLNFMLEDRVGKLDPTLNKIIEPRTAFEGQSGIWHFAGGWKPWSRRTQLHFIGPRASRLWESIAHDLASFLSARNSVLCSDFIDKWLTLQADMPSYSRFSIKRAAIFLLTILVGDPATKARRFLPKRSL
jgi:lipopolysaccharide biosynthesis glycosyltransferase